ncbi:hypothetical protein H6P81_020390 [Aristolochia fimbriata]|uniref:MAR-binding filament-like protein 1 n=1 Tax=Aristolochia fimbriata TaxID=158543 RepID=A0AAV7DU99_ARIFI|nr:hypothetical protein H6P81_020390 [Aristolochia fimbriata]
MCFEWWRRSHKNREAQAQAGETESGMPTLASLRLLPPPPLLLGRPHLRFVPFPGARPLKLSHDRLCQPLFASAGSFDGLGANRKSNSKESVLSNLIQEIEPLDVSVIQKDVPADTVDAIKRTISGMLGLLPSDHFHVSIEAFWEPLSKLLISSMMTGYTLRNAEYRLCLERNLDIQGMHFEIVKGERAESDDYEVLQKENGIRSNRVESKNLVSEHEKLEDDLLSFDGLSAQGLGKLHSEAQEYIHQLQARLLSAKNELHDLKRKNAALQMQQFVGEEKNDLLDYLRSLEPEKVAELSEPTSAEVQEIVRSVVHGLLATLSPKMHSKAALQSDNPAYATLDIAREDFAELVEDASLHFQPLISVTRDYLARLLFWCMLLGHHLRGLEYRLNLMKLLSLSRGDELES